MKRIWVIYVGRETGRRIAWELSRLHDDPLPDPELRAKLQAADAVFEKDIRKNIV